MGAMLCNMCSQLYCYAITVAVDSRRIVKHLDAPDVIIC